MKMNNVILAENKIAKKNKYITSIQKKIEDKISNYDFDFHNLSKSDFFIHDFFYVNQHLFIIYKQNDYRVLLLTDLTNNCFILLKTYQKTKNHYKYYNDFRSFAKKHCINSCF